ncbi:MAG TPA: twin-arginine translocase TatA/TatE family subunit [Candidatus Limnocylindrales bacterium]|nr:twin-arginine translocase TatA/TatE family subunit [Candidatus Limnocylindrales bacterium]
MLSIPDMALLGAAALLLFGPEQLPRVARKAGNVMREIQNTSQSFIREMERAADAQDEAEKKPYDAPPYEPAPYDAAAYDSPYDVARDEHEPYEPTLPFDEAPAPEPEPEPSVAEKLAEPRPALHAAEAAPQSDHPAHL